MTDDPGAQNAHNARNPAEHLAGHRWQKGRSGNPGGRPKGRSATAALRELALTTHNGRRLVDLLAERIFKEALSGKFPFAREVLERLEGKVEEPVKVETRGEHRVYICPPPRVIGEDEPLLAPSETEEPGRG